MLVFATVLLILPSLIYTTMDEEMAHISGVRTWLVHLLLLVMVVGRWSAPAARMVGMLMINALMILPGATARLVSRRFYVVLVVSLVVGIVGVSVSLLGAIGIAISNTRFSWLSSVPPGPIIVLTLFLIFLATWLAVPALSADGTGNFPRRRQAPCRPRPGPRQGRKRPFDPAGGGAAPTPASIPL